MSDCLHNESSAVTARSPGVRFTKYLTIYHKFIVICTSDSDLQRAKIPNRIILCSFTNSISNSFTILYDSVSESYLIASSKMC